MSFTTHKLLGTIGVIGVLASGQAHAQSSNDEISALKSQLRALEKKLDGVQKQANSTQKQTQKFAAAAAGSTMHTKAVPFVNATMSMPGNRPTFCTDDGANCVAVTGRIHLDTAAYSFSPKSAGTTPQSVNDGVNARRARLGLIGTLNRDWEWGLVVDAGGTTDGSVGLNNAYIAYKGIKGLVIQGGYIDVPYTLDEATSSNNIIFMERGASQVLATNLAAGDNRAAFGGHVFGDNYWVGAYVTGPTTGNGTVHNSPNPLGATFRAVGLPINNQVATVLLGFDGQYLSDTGGATNNTLGMSDRIEMRVDPGTNKLLNASLVNVNNARVLSGEGAVKYGSFLASGEYFDFNIERNGLSNVSFNGGYGQASYVLTGEQHKYSTSSGSFGGISPARPVNFSTGDLGAWELAVRYSYASLNDTTAGVRGGELKNTTVGLNWYVNNNMRFMFNWIHGTVDKFDTANVNNGADYDVFAMRTQVAW